MSIPLQIASNIHSQQLKSYKNSRIRNKSDKKQQLYRLLTQLLKRHRQKIINQCDDNCQQTTNMTHAMTVHTDIRVFSVMTTLTQEKSV